MDEQKKDETTTASGTPETETATAAVVETETTEVVEAEVVSVPAVETVTETVVTEVSPVAEVVSEAVPTVFNYKMYLGAVLAILAISAGLIFVLEKEGRISTGLFSTVIDKIESSKPAAKVNGTVITKAEYNSSLGQLTQMAGSQGANVTDAAVSASLKQQTLDTLVNGELLRQAAVNAGKTVTPEQIQTRFTEIETGLGGSEQLTAKMAEFGVDAESLRRDIENEFLIQAYFVDNKIGQEFATASEEEILNLYNQAGGVEAGLPPLAEIKDQVIGQIKLDKEQTQINDLLKTLRDAAEVEILI